MTLFSGRLLRIDLTGMRFREEEIARVDYGRFISARGLSVKFLHDELEPGADPLGPENRLILSTGVLAGSGLQGFSKWCVAAKSPLTGTVFRSITGGNFGVWMKHAGYDLIIVQGRASELSYIHIGESGVHFLGAGHLAGLDPRKTQAVLKETHGRRTESACIGLSGESLVRFAAITSGERTASRGGMGTVMGAKNLKALAISVPGRRHLPFDEGRFKALARDQIETLKAHPRRKNMTTLGTPYITEIVNSMGILPVRNFQEGSLEHLEPITGDRFYRIKRAKSGCYQCMTRCGAMRDVTKGPFRGTRIDGPEYESIYALGPLLGIADRTFVINANALCDYYGIDTISTGVCAAYACELFEREIISMADTDGLDLSWGNREALFDLIRLIGERKGMGRVLGEGVKRASESMGGEAPRFAMHIKGLELAGYDPRGVKGYALSMATSNIGGSHMYGRPRDELSGRVDPFSEKGKGDSIALVQKEQAVEDSMIACTFGNSGLDMEKYSELLLAATGMAQFGSRDNLLEIGERIVCLERCFNVREGFTRRDDSLPERMTSEALRNARSSTGQVVADLDNLIDEYYRAMGYTGEGVPTPQRLTHLGLQGAAGDWALPG